MVNEFESVGLDFGFWKGLNWVELDLIGMMIRMILIDLNISKYLISLAFKIIFHEGILAVE